MHAELRLGTDTLLLSDGMAQGKPRFEGSALSITVTDPAEAARIFAAMGEGGRVQMPLGPTFFARSFGMVADRFGVSWMILAA